MTRINGGLTSGVTPPALGSPIGSNISGGWNGFWGGAESGQPPYAGPAPIVGPPNGALRPTPQAYTMNSSMPASGGSTYGPLPAPTSSYQWSSAPGGGPTGATYSPFPSIPSAYTSGATYSPQTGAPPSNGYSGAYSPSLFSSSGPASAPPSQLPIGSVVPGFGTITSYAGLTPFYNGQTMQQYIDQSNQAINGPNAPAVGTGSPYNAAQQTNLSMPESPTLTANVPYSQAGSPPNYAQPKPPINDWNFPVPNNTNPAMDIGAPTNYEWFNGGWIPSAFPGQTSLASSGGNSFGGEGNGPQVTVPAGGGNDTVPAGGGPGITLMPSGGGDQLTNGSPLSSALNSLASGQPGQSSLTATPATTPYTVYTPQQTQDAVNQAVALAQQQANPYWMAVQTMRPGTGLSAGNFAEVAPAVAQDLAQGALAQQQIPFEQQLANQTNLLGGQVLQSAGANQLAGIGQNLSNLYNSALAQDYGLGINNAQFGLSNQMQQQNLLAQLMGNMMG